MVYNRYYLAVVAIVLAVVVVVAGCRQDPHAGRAEKMIRYLSDELDLTQAQQDMLNQFKDEMLERREEMQSARRLHMEEFMTQVQKETMDKDRLMAMVNETKPKIDDMVSHVITSMVEFHATLTPEQRAKLVEKLERMKKWHAYFHE